MTFQTDWETEFGGDNPHRVEERSQHFLAPLGGALRRYPLGRKSYNGLERSHRTDDEEFYLPDLLEGRDMQLFLPLSTRWVYGSNGLRPYTGVGMDHQSLGSPAALRVYWG